MPSKKKAVLVRFSDEEYAQLELLANRYTVSSSTILRWSLNGLRQLVQLNDGKITLPLDFSQICGEMVIEEKPYPGVATKNKVG